MKDIVIGEFSFNTITAKRIVRVLRSTLEFMVKEVTETKSQSSLFFDVFLFMSIKGTAGRIDFNTLLLKAI